MQERRIHRNGKHRIHDSAPPSTAEPGDRIVLYADGITEVFNSKGELHGIDGIREIARQTAALPSDEMKQGILDGVAAWRSGPRHDDVSLVLVQVR